ncbi:MAG: mRNA splicing protein prp18 [Thelocarpon superellum]|nr:MAG: mRNA splicing protein prp18 [Thelocarpon superellum]
MDFAALMSKEIQKVKQDTTAKTSTKSEAKYVKRAELEKQREAAYHAEQEAKRSEQEERRQKKRKLEHEEAQRDREREEKRQRLAEESRRRRRAEEEAEERARRKRLGLPERPAEKNVSAPRADDIPDDELIAKLRADGQPARLFAESHLDRFFRYKRLHRRPLIGFTTLELVPEDEMKVDKVPTDPEAKSYLFRQLASYFSMVLKEWEAALDQRPANVKDSHQGKAAYHAMTQAKEDMRPLFRRLERGELEVLEPVVEIVKAAQERRYVDANDGYLQLSIGKAAWPIGVTMVGIHERSAREKLHESEAHIMSDDVTRRFLQSIKRCLSFAQTRWPPDDLLQLMG